MTDKTLGEYNRTTPDPDETTGEALARLQAELARLLDEADAELRDEADGGVAATLIEKEAGGHGTAFWMSRWKEAVSQRDEALYQRDQWRRGSDSWRATLDEAIEERRRIARALGLPESVTVDAMVARIEEVESARAAEQLRALLTAYGDQDADADGYEGRLSVFLARHGARVATEEDPR